MRRNRTAAAGAAAAGGADHVDGRGALLGLLGACEVGCATLMRGPTERVEVVTEPPGAVALHDGARCETPCTFEARRDRDVEVELSKDGYEPAVIVLRSRLGATVLGNLLLSGPGILVGIPVDVATGSAYQLVPAVATLALRPAAPVPARTGHGHGPGLRSLSVRHARALATSLSPSTNRSPSGAVPVISRFPSCTPPR